MMYLNICWTQGKTVMLMLSRHGAPLPEQMIVPHGAPAMDTESAQLTEENEDFASRERYHQSEVVKGNHFTDYPNE